MEIDYEMKWSEGRKEANGSYSILPGNVFAPKSVDLDEKSYWESVSEEYAKLRYNEFDFRLAKAAATWLKGPVAAWLNDNGYKRDDAILNFPVSTENMRMLINLIEVGLIDFTTAKNKVFTEMVKATGETPFEIMERLGLFIEKDDDFLDTMIDEVLAANTEKVALYKGGKTGLFGMLMGELMRKSGGKFDAKSANPRLLEKINMLP